MFQEVLTKCNTKQPFTLESRN